jgi:hypothetical protein
VFSNSLNCKCAYIACTANQNNVALIIKNLFGVLALMSDFMSAQNLNSDKPNILPYL